LQSYFLVCKFFYLNVNQSGLMQFQTISFSFIVISCFLLSCFNAGSASDRAEIEKVWKRYYSPSVSHAVKNKLLSEAFKKNYMEELNSVFYEKESDLRKKSFKEKLNILAKRAMVDSLSLSIDQLDTFEKAFNRIETTSTLLIPTENGLNDILFSGKNKAYGIFSVFISEKSNQFVKEEGRWKINPSKEHAKFLLSRKMLKHKYVKEYGSEDAAIEELMKVAVGRPAMWSPIMN